MGDLGEQDGYPVGVSNADFAGSTEPVCANCYHPADDHHSEGSHYPCDACTCPDYEPLEDTRA